MAGASPGASTPRAASGASVRLVTGCTLMTGPVYVSLMFCVCRIFSYDLLCNSFSEVTMIAWGGHFELAVMS